jgi:hypothetical protein
MDVDPFTGSNPVFSSHVPKLSLVAVSLSKNQHQDIPIIHFNQGHTGQNGPVIRSVLGADYLTMIWSYHSQFLYSNLVSFAMMFLYLVNNSPAPLPILERRIDLWKLSR